MPPPKTRIILLVALGHLAVLALLFLLAAPRTDDFYTSPVTAVELVAALEAELPPAEEEAAKPEPEPEPLPEPDPVPDPVEEPPPEEEEARPPPRRIIRQVAAPDIPRSDLKERLRQRLDRVETSAPAVTASREERFPYSWYNNFVQSKMHSLWKRPTRAAVGRDRASAVVSFRVFRDGRIENIRLQESSGSPVMDESVLQAARMADPLPPLPSGFRGPHEDFLILFELK